MNSRGILQRTTTAVRWPSLSASLSGGSNGLDGVARGRDRTGRPRQLARGTDRLLAGATACSLLTDFNGLADGEGSLPGADAGVDAAQTDGATSEVGCSADVCVAPLSPPANLLLDPGFEAQTGSSVVSPWHTNAPTKTAPSSTGCLTGSGCITLKADGGMFDQYVSVTAGRTYTLRFSGKKSNASYGGVWVYVGINGTNVATTQFDLATTYAQMSMSFTAPAGQTQLWVQFGGSLGAGVTATVDDVSVTPL